MIALSRPEAASPRQSQHGASHGGGWVGEQRAGARRSMANPYQWFSAAERVRTGTLASVSKWHS